MINKRLARNVDQAIAAEQVKQLFGELLAAGFTEKQAIEYTTSLVSKLILGLMDKKKK